jgi:hypothetical protein
MLTEAGGPRLVYGGMNDAWLAAMAESTWPLARLSIRMDRPEMQLLRALKAEVSLDDLLGPGCVTLLESGFKVELEAGLNPAFHGDAQRRWALGYLRTVAAGPTPGRRPSLAKGRRTRG